MDSNESTRLDPSIGRHYMFYEKTAKSLVKQCRRSWRQTLLPGIFTRLTPGWSIDSITIRKLRLGCISLGFEVYCLFDDHAICLAICTTLPRPGRQDGLASATHTRAVAAFEAQEKQDALADIWDMTLQFESERIKYDFIRRHAKRQFYSEAEVVEDGVPHRMQTIRCNRAKELAEKHPLFANGRNAEMLGAMAQVMERTTYYAKEIIFTGSSHGDRLYFICSGMVDLYREEITSPFWILTHGESFGFEPYFCLENFITTRARTKCVLFKVSASD
jgi:hypothetical protein